MIEQIILSFKTYIMSGRGDNNKNGTSGQGSSNQSNRGFNKKQPKSNHGRQAGGKPSVPQAKEEDQDSNRNVVIDESKKHSTDADI